MNGRDPAHGIRTRQEQIPAAEAMLVRQQAIVERRATALVNMRKLIEKALLVESPGVWDAYARQYRQDLIALGCSPAELDAAGIRS